MKRLSMVMAAVVMALVLTRAASADPSRAPASKQQVDVASVSVKTPARGEVLAAAERRSFKSVLLPSETPSFRSTLPPRKLRESWVRAPMLHKNAETGELLEQILGFVAGGLIYLAVLALVFYARATARRFPGVERFVVRRPRITPRFRVVGSSSIPKK